MHFHNYVCGVFINTNILGISSVPFDEKMISYENIEGVLGLLVVLAW